MSSSAIAFVVVLNFVLGNGHEFQTTVRCPDMQCVQSLLHDSRDSTTLTRFRAFDADTFALIVPGRQAVFPPFLDEHRL